ncbi:actin-related protein 2/3 complex subunit 5-like protein [Babylonia areolata]|uniref:actin-related protein 2/3 complex subunit 5-like protein n=1 Tax=Babylonia areolata TaxID=304850 RepID=UPI003FCF2BE4
MAKNTGSSKFRKVDVDQYDEDKYVDENEADVDSADSQGANDAEVNTLLAQGKNLDALKLVLTCAPVASKNQAVKDRATNTAVRVLSSFKTAEIDKAVKSLDARNVDMLMKYIYRGFEFPTDGSSAVLLTWHEKTFAVGGSGSIIRVLTDRKRV